MFVLICNNNIVNLINIFVVAFLTYFVISKRLLIMFFEAFICLRNLFCLCFFRILLFLLYVRTYVVYSLKMQHCRRNFLISLIIFVHFVVYSNLIFLYNLVYKVKFSIIFFKVSSNFVVYLLMQFLFIKSFNINSSNKFLNILLNFSKFIAFQFCLRRC